MKATQEEFDSVKAVWKARIAEHESRQATLSAMLNAGFEMRMKECVVVYRPKDRKKDYFLAAPGISDVLDGTPVLTEDMMPDDYQQELIEAESIFDKQCRIDIFQPTGPDYGTIVVGFLADRWYAACRCQVGTARMEERLDSEQQAFKERFDSINAAGDRFAKWASANLKAAAKGFVDPLAKAIAAQEGCVE